MLTIVEQPAVTEAVHEAIQKYQRTEDQWDALRWTLARDPKFGSALTESGKTRLAVIQGAQSIDMPTIEAIYEIEDPYIVIHKVTFSKAKAIKAGHA